MPESTQKIDEMNLATKTKRTAFGALQDLSHKAPTKKIQLQLKNWTAKANSTEASNDNLAINFVAEESAHKHKAKSKFIDFDFLCCLLCDIKFISEEELLKHVHNSEEHAQKFEDYWKQSITEPKDSECYLDRSAERRDAFGVDEEELKKIVKAKQDSRATERVVLSPHVSISSDESIGAKLM